MNEYERGFRDAQAAASKIVGDETDGDSPFDSTIAVMVDRIDRLTPKPDSALTVDEQTEFEVWGEDEMHAGACGPRSKALAEARRYAAQYVKDGSVRIEEVTRRVVETLHPHSSSTCQEPK